MMALPKKREKPKHYQACAHTFFDELREPGTKLPSGRELPVLFNFTEQVKHVDDKLDDLLREENTMPFYA